MRSAINVIYLQFVNWKLILRLSKFERKAIFGSYRLGNLWVFLNPLIQIAVYYLIFGVATSRGAVSENNIPYILWLLAGIIPWFYISSNIIQGANAIYSQLAIISKTNMPATILPTVVLVNNLNNLIVMGSILFLVAFLTNRLLYMNLYLLLYYTFSMLIFVFSLNLLTSTITILLRDFQLILNSSTRLLIFVSGVILQFNLSPDSLLYKLLQLNPILFIIQGFRQGMFGIQKAEITWINHFYFWNFIIVLYSVGAFIHTKYRRNYSNYI
ncbi:ABC transporter permease [Carnobacterium maltaromaticum]|uniref:ABC transporter permease n=1 Tax=Carnobacterium maltaromaticum TaxID=2751 RepID=UPI000C78168F|nr:ABC transporter permease [Carnobacterium maltaromaticum]PLS56846.1 ABC transporter permease [Carnobacterium maltaromaticum]PLS57318.1 ABC transporter permease [Carnobacterium maltaromaticum]